ncbi:MAG: 6-phosphogluconolactonase [Actinomycetota bacterium]
MELVRSSMVVDAGAATFEAALREALDRGERASLALSGGSSPWPVLEALASSDLPWDRIDVFQVDERVAPDGDDARNLTGLRRVLIDHVPATLHPMPVTEDDLTAAAAAYAARLPATIDVVHLGLGDDGHTASLVPADPVLDVVDRTVAVTEPYRGHRRMTLTYPALHRAGRIIWYVAGAGKEHMLSRLVATDPEIPAGRVAADRATVVTDLVL